MQDDSIRPLPMPLVRRARKTAVAKSLELLIKYAATKRSTFADTRMKNPIWMILFRFVVLTKGSMNFCVTMRPLVCPVNMIPISKKDNDEYFCNTTTGSNITHA
jgi:hypothetical protein